MWTSTEQPVTVTDVILEVLAAVQAPTPVA
jgi:hypothetical protein